MFLGSSESFGTNAQGFALTNFGLLGQNCYFFQQKSLNFSMFQQFSQTSFSVLDLTGLMERFYCIATGRTLF